MVVIVLRSSWQSKEIMSSVHWMVDSSDAPYSVVAPLWTTDGISIGFWLEFRGISFSRSVQPKINRGIKW
jgi:hypothetical protein